MASRRRKIRIVSALFACALAIYFLSKRAVAPSSGNRYKQARKPPRKNEKQRGPLSNRVHCKPRKNIVFVKTHKTGSSTVTNILHRYGDKHDLTFALPRPGQYRLDWPWMMRNSSFQFTSGTQPNILCYHGRYNRDTLERVMPRETVYVTILRNPVSQYESTYSYMAFDELLRIRNKTTPMERFLENPSRFLVNYLLSEDLRVNSDRLKLIRNGMAFDLGLNSTYFDDSAQIKAFQRKLKEQFDLVMLTEFFDESIMLLKELMCWPLEEFFYFNLNMRYRNETKRMFSEKTFADMRRWNNVDFLIYEQFRDILLQKITQINMSKSGIRFRKDIAKLRSANDQLRKLCLRSVTKTRRNLYGVVVKRLELNGRLGPEVREMCDQMRRNEADYIRLLREKKSGFWKSVVVERFKDKVASFLRLLLGVLNRA